jgi:cellulose synthase/poly-beta-1,6-N-acetylglucosamine synthase-like glycosyltransferase
MHHVSSTRDAVAVAAQISDKKGKLQKINVMVCTYNEPMETVEACVRHILEAEAPVYAEKVVYIGDDGAKKKFQCSEDKRVMVERFNASAPSITVASRALSAAFAVHAWRTILTRQSRCLFRAG